MKKKIVVEILKDLLTRPELSEEIKTKINEALTELARK